jgi:alpha-1,3-mannosyltransferase
MISEPVFHSREFALALLLLTFLTLLIFANKRWKPAGIVSTALYHLKSWNAKPQIYSSSEIVTTLFTSQIIGIAFARSLHYQFYSWYFWTLPFLAFKAFHPSIRKINYKRLLSIALFLFAIEICWNIYPSTKYSSTALLCCHLTLIFALWTSSQRSSYSHQIKQD